jgi:hypothetical protein
MLSRNPGNSFETKIIKLIFLVILVVIKCNVSLSPMISLQLAIKPRRRRLFTKITPEDN